MNILDFSLSKTPQKTFFFPVVFLIIKSYSYKIKRDSISEISLTLHLYKIVKLVFVLLKANHRLSQAGYQKTSKKSVNVTKCSSQY